VDDEGVLDPWVAEWIEANPMYATPMEDFSPEILELARGPYGPPPTIDIADVRDDTVGDVPVRFYRHNDAPTGLVVYLHGGGFVLGSIDIMDGVAREIADKSGAAVVSVGYRLAPEHPFPEGLDDCEAVTRWAVAHAADFGVAPELVAVAGESAGGNLSAAVALRLRDAGDTSVPPLAGQVLLYPVVAGETEFPSQAEFDGLIIGAKASAFYSEAYAGGRDIGRDPYAAPLHAVTLSGLPPALIVLGGCDMLRDEGRAYAARLREDGVDVTERCYAGQPHGFLNFGFPAAADAYELVGRWLRDRFASVRQTI
jgi:acetyl esterase